MNGNPLKIEIFEPFGEAYEAMKKILFQPFDLAKWCVIGFAAFLSGAWGGGFNFRFPTRANSDLPWLGHHEFWSSGSHSLWFIPVMISLSGFVLIIAVVLMWVAARGRFIFTDCVVKNRAAIAVPWHEYRREGNSFFLFSLIVGFVFLVVTGILVLSIGVPMGLFSHSKVAKGFHALGVIALVFAGLIGLACSLFFVVVTHFMIPIMYRRRCLAREAFVDVIHLMLAQPGPIVLYVLFGIVLMLGFGIVSTIITCLTCCLAGFPYISSVVFLPIFSWLLLFKLLFLRQFGPDYDVWAVAEVPAAATLPPSPPPPADQGGTVPEPPTS